ncbi:type II secretion system protein GspK [Diaphorobacter sp.]|jgi:general secretion pathway protein K|uniref:general secretion pathway protein GspK n=1 Tax=Diaphorobacter sp. TaxID=1934310 RepID=UPI0025909A2D|nr:type II secretion system protein GspK [Diaphorobacter sp.]
MPARERGIALILVLWVVTLLAVIAGSFVYGARGSALAAGNLVALAKARALADAGIHRGLYELGKPATDAERWLANGREYAFTLDDTEIRVSMRDEAAKIDLNTANDTLLKSLLQSAGLSEEDANQLLDAILDWRDADDLARPQGAERDRYEAQGLPYIPPNAPFRTVEELQQVIGINPGLYRRLAGALTVHSRQAGINSTLAPREVLLALPNASAEDVDAYLVAREDMLAAGMAPLPFPPAAGFESGASSQVYNLRSFAKAADGTQFVREAVARVTQDPKQPFVFLRWLQGQL